MKKIILFLFACGLYYSGFSQGWCQRANYPNVGRHRASGFSIGTKGYIGLGHVNGAQVNVVYKDWWEFDPSSNSWTQKADFPTNNGDYAAIAFSTSTKGYVGGGAMLNGEFFEYNPLNNTWTAIANCPDNPSDEGSFSINDKGYVYVGSSLYEFDPALNTWNVRQSAPIAFATWSVCFSIGNSGYVKSGSSFYEYKPSINQWIQRATFPGLNTNGGSTFIRDNKGYVVSGFVGSLTNVTSEVWEYNPGNNSWTRMADFLGTSRRFAVGFTINNKGYTGTGTNGINFNDFWEFDDNVSVNDISQADLKLDVFPNPAIDYVVFSLSFNENYFQSNNNTIQLFDITGNLITENKFTGNNCRIDRNNISAGIYFYQLICDSKKVRTGKIIFN